MLNFAEQRGKTLLNCTEKENKGYDMLATLWSESGGRICCDNRSSSITLKNGLWSMALKFKSGSYYKIWFRM